MNRNQKHLNHIDAINLGSYYTPRLLLIWLILFCKIILKILKIFL